MVSIILVEPQMGENIGASARAIKNFGFTDLRIVKPRDGWPNDKAQSMSANAEDIIRQARIYQTVQEATKDLNFLYATAHTERSMNKEQVFLNEFKINDHIEAQKIGIMFGRESTGLSNEEISFANKIL